MARRIRPGDGYLSLMPEPGSEDQANAATRAFEWFTNQQATPGQILVIGQRLWV